MFQNFWMFVLISLAGWMNRQQQDVIAYLQEENRILRERLGPRRLLLNDTQKRRLAVAAAKLGRNTLQQCATLFTPETLLRWHRFLVAHKYDGSGKRGPAPATANSVRRLVLRMAEKNPDWGYGHIHGELKELGFKVSWQTVRRIMRGHGLLDDPDKPKKLSWTTFIKAHFQSVAACDFFTVEAWTPQGLTRFLVFFVIDVSSRRVQIAGIDRNPDEQWMIQQARNLTDPENGFLKRKRVLIHDRDQLYTDAFRKTLRQGGIRSLKMPKQSPNLNAYSERFVQTIKNECVNKMVFFGEKHVRYVINQYVDHYNTERPHQGLGNRRIEAIEPEAAPLPTKGRVLCKERLGGLLKSYYRRAA